MKYSTSIPTDVPLARKLFDSICARIAVPFDAVLTHATSWNEFLNLDLQNDLLFIAFEDSPNYHIFPAEYDYWSGHQEPGIFSDIRSMALENLSRTIVLFLQGNHYDDSYFNLPNIRVAKWYTIPENNRYPSLTPVTKNLLSQKIGIALNRQMRSHRLALCSLLYGLNLDQHCKISTGHLYKQLDKLSSNEFLDHNPWQYESHNEHARDIMRRGFSQMISSSANLEFAEFYEIDQSSDRTLWFDNINNFNQNLRPLYADSFVEIVSNRLFCEPAVNIDEKFINTIYGRNFPILISSVGTVELYRQFGFDMFDDVVDHSYDQIKNPIDRLWVAIDLNKHLILDPTNTIKTWTLVQDRFDSNILYAREKFYKKLENMTLCEYNRVMGDFLESPFDIR